MLLSTQHCQAANGKIPHCSRNLKGFRNKQLLAGRHAVWKESLHLIHFPLQLQWEPFEKNIQTNTTSHTICNVFSLSSALQCFHVCRCSETQPATDIKKTAWTFLSRGTIVPQSFSGGASFFFTIEEKNLNKCCFCSSFSAQREKHEGDLGRQEYVWKIISQSFSTQTSLLIKHCLNLYTIQLGARKHRVSSGHPELYRAIF